MMKPLVLALTASACAAMFALGVLVGRVTARPEGDGRAAANLHGREERLSSGDVTVWNYRVERGSPEDSLVRRGLMSAAAHLSGIVTKVRHKRPYVHGSLEGELLVDVEGTTSGFDEWGQESYGDADSLIPKQFAATSVGQKWFGGTGCEFSVRVIFHIAKPSQPRRGAGI